MRDLLSNREDAGGWWSSAAGRMAGCKEKRHISTHVDDMAVMNRRVEFKCFSRTQKPRSRKLCHSIHPQ